MSRARRNLVLAIPAAALGAAGAGAGVFGTLPSGAALSLGLAALVGAGGRTALAIGFLGLVAAFSSLDPAPLRPLELAGYALAGAAAGLLVRAADRALPWLAGPRGAGSAVLLSLLLGALAVPASPQVRLLDADGSPLLLQAVVHDPIAATRALVPVPGIVTAPHALSGVATAFSWLAPAVAWAFLVALALGRARAAWALAAVLGALALAAGTSGLAQLLGGQVPLPDSHGLALEVARRTGVSGAVHIVDPPAAARLGLASRPLSDALDVVMGIALLGLAARHLRRTAAAAGSAPPVFAPAPVLGAAALLVLAALAFAPTGPAWVLGATGLLALAGALGALFGDREDRLPHDLVLGGLALQVAGFAGHLAGWLQG